LAKSGVWSDPHCIKGGSCVNGMGWWYWANAAHVLGEYQRLAKSGHQDYGWALDTIYSKNLHKMTSSNFFDDEGWWGLALIRFYKATNKRDYLNQAKNIANDMKNRGHQSVCGNGGIFWDAAKTQVGAIANELLISLSAKIALMEDPNGPYRRLAIDTWNWLSNSGIIGGDGTVFDHYNVNNKNSCGGRVDWTFTYTHGVILSALTDLWKLTSDFNYLNKANQIARTAMNRFGQGGNLNDGFSNGDARTIAGDAFLFKGILASNLAYLALSTNDGGLKNDIRNFLNNNYNALIGTQGTGRLYGYVWNQGVNDRNPADIITHISALHLMSGVIQLN